MTDDPAKSKHIGWAVKRPDPKLNKKLRPRAQQLRKEQTPAEVKLWGHLRNRQRLGYKFRRQHIIDRYIVDFYCAEARLVIELDGDVHALQVERDEIRQEFLERLGLRVIRFINPDINQSLEGVLNTIEAALREQEVLLKLSKGGLDSTD